jgi:hypothetical protein
MPKSAVVGEDALIGALVGLGVGFPIGSPTRALARTAKSATVNESKVER